MTPRGRYTCARAAAEAYGITRQAAALRAREGTDGWYYTAYAFFLAPDERS